MFNKLTVFQTAHAMSVHAGARQALIAQNVANADTPGYSARDLAPFSQLAKSRESFAGSMRSTRSQHNSADTPVDVALLSSLAERSEDPNENGVSIEEEMVRAAEVKKDHDRALAIYRSALTIMRMSLGGS